MTTIVQSLDPLNPLAARDGRTEPAWTVGGVWLDALARRDFPGLEACLAPDVAFRALVPPGLLQENTAAGAVGHLRRWFGAADRFQLTDAALGQVGPVLYLRWCVRTVDVGGTARVVEQHAYARVDQRITRLDLLCSGFHAAEVGGGSDVR